MPIWKYGKAGDRMEKFVIRSGNAFPFMNLVVAPGGHQGILLWELFLQASAEHKYIYFTVKNSRIQSISQGLHFSISYDGLAAV